jgi:hypothetical protein
MADMDAPTTVIVNGQPMSVPANFYNLPLDQQNDIVDRTSLARGIGKQPVYSGSILPISKDASGNISFDWKAGLPATIARSLYDAGTLPGDVATGRQPAFDPVTGGTAPSLIDRSINLAGTFNPTSPGNIAARPSWLRPPTATELKATGGAQLDAARATGTQIQGGAVGNMATDLQQKLDSEGFIQPIAPKTHALLDAMQPPAPNATINIAGLQAARQRFMAQAIGSDAQEAAAAAQAVKHIDNLLENLPPAQTVGGTATPQEVSQMLQTGRANYAAGQRANAISGELDDATTGILERAQGQAAASNSGRNFDNLVRQKVNAFLSDEHNLLGFSPQEIGMLKAVRDGTATQNHLRYVANLLGGGGGWGQASTATRGGAAGVVGGLLSGLDPLASGAVGTVAPAVGGTLAKMLENILARRSISAVDEALRSRSPMHQAREFMQQPATALTARDAAVLHSLAPGLLAPPQPLPQSDGYATSDDPAFNRRLPPGYI